MSEDYGIRPVPPRYNEYNSFYIYTSEGYRKAVEEIEASEREQAENEVHKAMEEDLSTRELDSLSDKERLEAALAAEEEKQRTEEYTRERDREILDEIRLKEEQIAAQRADVQEYEEENQDPPGTKLDLLA